MSAASSLLRVIVAAVAATTADVVFVACRREDFEKYTSSAIKDLIKTTTAETKVSALHRSGVEEFADSSTWESPHERQLNDFLSLFAQRNLFFRGTIYLPPE